MVERGCLYLRAIIALLLAGFIFLVGTLYHYNVGGKNADDKLVFFATTAIFSFNLDAWQSLQQNINIIANKCGENSDNSWQQAKKLTKKEKSEREVYYKEWVSRNDAFDCRVQTKERLSVFFNYPLQTALTKLSFLFFSFISSDFYQIVSLSYTMGMFFLHLISYVLLIYLVYKLKPTISWFIIFSMMCLLVVGKGFLGLPLDQLSSFFITNNVHGLIYEPNIYVARGPLGWLFLALTACFFSGKAKWYPFLALLMVLFHVGQALVLNIIFLTLLIVEQLFNKLEKKELDLTQIWVMAIVIVVNYGIFNTGYHSETVLNNLGFWEFFIALFKQLISGDFLQHLIIGLFFIILGLNKQSQSNYYLKFAYTLLILWLSLDGILAIRNAAELEPNGSSLGQLYFRIQGNTIIIITALTCINVFLMLKFLAKKTSGYFDQVWLKLLSSVLILSLVLMPVILTGKDYKNFFQRHAPSRINHFVTKFNNLEKRIPNKVKSIPSDLSDGARKWGRGFDIESLQNRKISISELNPVNEEVFHMQLHYYIKNYNLEPLAQQKKK